MPRIPDQPPDLGPSRAPSGVSRPVTVVRAGSAAASETRELARERLLAIRLVDGESFTLMCTPGEEVELALGFLRAEGWIDALGEVELAELCEGGDAVRVRLRRAPTEPPAARRNLVLYASCGMCGREDALPYLAALAPVPTGSPLPVRAFHDAAERLRDHQPLFRATGGSHAAALFDATGEIRVVAEDVGRHAAFDKAIGKAMRGGLETQGLAGFLSGRASLEMVAKAARSRLAALVSVGAPTDAAVDLAERLGLGLAGFVRADSMTVYASRNRFAI